MSFFELPIPASGVVIGDVRCIDCDRDLVEGERLFDRLDHFSSTGHPLVSILCGSCVLSSEVVSNDITVQDNTVPRNTEKYR